MNVYVSVPEVAKTEEASQWERAIAARIPAGSGVIVITDLVDGKLRIRSAHMVTGGQVADFTEPVERILSGAH